jgi:hypothetical protein
MRQIKLPLQLNCEHQLNTKEEETLRLLPLLPLLLLLLLFYHLYAGYLQLYT